MLALKGMYENGSVSFPLPVPFHERMEVIVTFLNETDEPGSTKVDLNSFSFVRSREISKGFKGSCADALIEERRNSL